MINYVTQKIYKRILLKLSGEVLQGNDQFGIDIKVLNRIAKEIKELVKLDIQIGIVIGGGNLFRGSFLEKVGINRVVSHHIGMLATVINGLAMQDALQRSHVNTYLMSSITLGGGLCNDYSWIKAINLLCNNNIIIFTAGTGNPFFTTDSAACLRGIEINAEVILKATKVDGVFSEDPIQHPDAIFYDKLSYQDVLDKKLKIMDTSAFILARDNNMPIHIFNITKPKALWQVVMGNKEGTLINH